MDHRPTQRILCLEIGAIDRISGTRQSSNSLRIKELWRAPLQVPPAAIAPDSERPGTHGQECPNDENPFLVHSIIEESPAGMPTQSRDVAPGKDRRSVVTSDGKVLRVPDDWELLPPGDAGLTRRVKAAGPSWTVKQKRGRRVYSLGVWAPRERIKTAREALTAERSTEAYAKRRRSDAKRREKQQSAYVEDFRQAVIDFLRFDTKHCEMAARLADAVADHATPVGSGTVARTKRIPIQRRAESAVIAWMRHQTTAYDSLEIPRGKGRRREVRQLLAARSRRLLQKYRDGKTSADDACPLQRALRRIDLRGDSNP